MSDSSPNRLSKIPSLMPTSPKRRPLAQRSDSEANTSTIRLVAGEPSEVYAKSPFPSHPSQVLSPKVSKLPPQRYAPFVETPILDKDGHVSDENTPTNRSILNKSQYEAPALRSLRSRKPNRMSTSTSASDLEADTSILTTSTLTTNETLLTTPSSSRQSSRTTPPSSPIEASFFDRKHSFLDPVDEETSIASPAGSPSTRFTIRAIAPSASSDRLPLHAKDSIASLISSSSALSVQEATRDNNSQPSSPSSANFQVYAHSSSEISLHTIQGQALGSSPAPSIQSKPIHSSASLESIVSEDARTISCADRPRSISSPPRPQSHASESSLINTAIPIRIQYPVVRPPSVSGSWAELSSPTSSNTTSRMREESQRLPPWSSRLSTIASESERSNSYSTSTDSTRRGKRRKTIGSFTSGGPQSSFSDARSSEWEYGSGVLTGTESNISFPIPQPLFSPRPLPSVPDESFSQSRDSDERDDIVGELQAPYLRSQRSGILTRFSSKSSLRPSSADSSRSQISFIGDLMWARRYYSNGEPANMFARNGSFVSVSSGAPRINTATSGITSSPISETVPSNIWRPRNRPRDDGRQPERRLRQETRRIYRLKQRRDSRAISEESELSVPGRSRRTRSLSTPELSVNEMMYSPHLRRDRRQTERYGTWAAPSLDEPFSRAMFSQLNRQILCFALGFILPMAWWVAAFLPLPPRPGLRPSSGGVSFRDDEMLPPPNSANPSEFSLQDKRWQKARWWRRVNRVLGIFGLVLVGTIIAVAVIGSRGNGSGPNQASRSPITIPSSSS